MVVSAVSRSFREGCRVRCHTRRFSRERVALKRQGRRRLRHWGRALTRALAAGDEMFNASFSPVTGHDIS